MNIEVLPDDESLARRAADFIASESRAAIERRGRFVLAVSGGHTPRRMLRLLANEKLPWDRIYVFQVDERVAPDGDPDRNATYLHENLTKHAPLLPPQNVLVMPVTAENLQAAAAEYAGALKRVAGDPPVLDLAHLGIGTDGHTASLIPRDPVLNVKDADVALAGSYQGRRRMTLTFPMINRSRCILWVVAGMDKSEMLLRLYQGDPGIPAGRIAQNNTTILADKAVASRLPPR